MSYLIWASVILNILLAVMFVVFKLKEWKYPKVNLSKAWCNLWGCNSINSEFILEKEASLLIHDSFELRNSHFYCHCEPAPSSLRAILFVIARSEATKQSHSYTRLLRYGSQ